MGFEEARVTASFSVADWQGEHFRRMHKPRSADMGCLLLEELARPLVHENGLNLGPECWRWATEGGSFVAMKGTTPQDFFLHHNDLSDALDFWNVGPF